jgi:O-antigen ligase
MMCDLPRRIGLLLFLVLLCAAPLKFGLAEAGIAISMPADAAEWLLFSYPNQIAHVAVVVVGVCAVLALALRTVPRPPPAALWAGVGWCMLVLAMLAADRLVAADLRADGTRIQFALYGVWFMAASVYLRNAQRREYAVTLLLLGGAIACVEAVRQYAVGLEEMRVYAARQAGYPDFTAFTNALLGAHPDSATLLFIRKLSGARVFGTFVYPNALGGFLIVMLPLGFGLLASSRKALVKLLAVLAVGLGLAALMLSRSKASIAIVTAALCGMMTLAWHAGRVGRRAWIAGCLAAVFAAVGMLAWGYGEGLGERLAATGGARLDYWRAALRMIAERPLTGWGTGGFTRLYPLMCRPGAEATRLAHNVFLTLWADYGIGALIGLGLALGTPLVAGWRKALRLKTFDWLTCAALCAATGFVMHSLADFDFHVAGITLPALAALAMGTGTQK